MNVYLIAEYQKIKPIIHANTPKTYAKNILTSNQNNVVNMCFSAVLQSVAHLALDIEIAKCLRGRNKLKNGWFGGDGQTPRIDWLKQTQTPKCTKRPA